MTQYRAAVFGCGMIGGLLDSPHDNGKILTHAHAYHAHESFQLTACCDTDKNILTQFNKRWGDDITPYDDPEKLIAKEKIDIASVAVNTSAHKKLIASLIESSSAKMIVCEKPIADNAEELNDIAKMIERHSDKMIMINFPRRYNPGFTELEDIIKSKKLGAPVTFTGTFSKGLYHNGCHYLELLERYLGQIKSLQSCNTRTIDDDFYGNFVLELERCSGTINNFNPVGYSHGEMMLFFEQGAVKIADSGHIIEIQTPVESPVYKGYKILSSKRILEDTMARSFYFVIDTAGQFLESKRDWRESFNPLFAFSRRMIALKEGLSSGQKKIIFD